MNQCKSIGCSATAMHPMSDDHCRTCYAEIIATSKEEASGLFRESVENASSGGDNHYWVAYIKHPKRLVPYCAECEDLIEHFEMSFQEGEAFKALWRKGQARIGNGKPGDTPLRNAQKVQHFGGRMVAMEERKL